MRNLKRVLALALALVMVIGMMVIGSSAATYSDEAAIAPEYADAVEILTGMGIFQGTGTGFAPKATLSRAEAAALIYRVITADVDDAKIDLYDYSSFEDVEAGKWYTGYITYAANGGYLKGYDGKAMPNDKVTGVQVLAIMLRAAGYGQNGEYEGAGWMDNILTDAQELGLLAGVNVKSLAVPATREIVAQLIFNAMTKAFIVTYTPALGYLPVSIPTSVGAIGAGYVQTLGWKNFALESEDTQDKWGRPSVVWFADDKTDNDTCDFNETVYATIEEKATATFTVATSECQIATAVGMKGAKADYTVYTNGVGNGVPTEINATDYITKLGGQGALLEVYEDSKIIVIVDTFLAKVDNVKAATYDPANHKITPARMDLTIYNSASGQAVYTTNAVADYTYAKNDMILVNVVTAGTNDDTIRRDWSAEAIAGGYKAAHVEIIGIAPVTTGKQTSYSDVTASSVIGGITYNWANKFNLGYKGTNNVTYNVYTDSYGNEIGLTIPQTAYTYGVISAMAWTNSYFPLTTSYAAANLVDVNSTPIAGVTMAGEGSVAATGAVVTSSPFLGEQITNVQATKPNVNPNVALNTTYYKTLYQFAKNAQGAYVIVDTGVQKAAQTITTSVANNWDGFATNDYTVYLVETKVAGQSVYNTYTGYKNVPSMGNVTISYLEKGAFVEYVYVDATAATYAGSKSIVYIGDFAYDGMDGSNYTYKVYNGATPTEMAVAGGKTLTLADGIITNNEEAGVFEITTNLDGEITSATNYFYAYANGSGKGLYINDLAGYDGTVINGTTGADYISNNCTGAPIYKMAGANVITSNGIDLLAADRAWCVVDPTTGIVTAIYHF